MQENSHAFTLSIDWEDFGQLLSRDQTGIVTPPLKNIDRQTDIMLSMLDDSGKKATFFILGMLAHHRPDLVKKIAAEGHEIGLHGEHHVDMRKLTYQQAYDDLRDCHNLVTDIIGGPVYGYRAPYFSINESNLYVLEILADLGLMYDSSIFPLKMKRYGIAGFPARDTLYELPNGKTIVELPLTIADMGKKKLPVAGGGYIRAYPRFFVRKVFRELNEKKQDVMIYMHPYEFDTQWIDSGSNYPPEIPRPAVKTFLINLRWNLFRDSIRGKIRDLLKSYHFITCKEKAEYVKSRTHRPAILGRAQ